MNLGLFSNWIMFDNKQIIYFSLPYLDPTDPFFQKVAVELLTEVCKVKDVEELHGYFTWDNLITNFIDIKNNRRWGGMLAFST